MKTTTFYLIASLSILFSSTFISLKSQTDTKFKSINYKDSVLRSYQFITVGEAGKILGKPARLLDTLHKFSNGLLRYKIEYVAAYKDSTSKGRVFFMFEQYADAPTVKSIYDNLKTENEKTAKVTPLNGVGGEEAFLAKDNFNYPFILVRKGNKLFKFKLYYLDAKVSLDELEKVAKKIVATH